MKKIVITLLLALIVLIAWTNSSFAQVAGEAQLEQQMLDLVNKERAKEGLAPLEMDAKLVELARLKSQDMIDKNYFSHTSPTYGDPFQMMKDFGVEYLMAGENLAGNFSLTGAHEALMNSPGHRANILKPEFTHIGIGVVKGGPYGMMITQMFIKARGEVTSAKPVQEKETASTAPVQEADNAAGNNVGVNPEAQAGKEQLKIFYNNKEIIFPDLAPYINKSQRIMVPLRFISQELGFQVNWNAVEQKISITKGENGINLWVGKPIVLKDKQILLGDTAPEIHKGRTVVPLRLVSELLGCKVTWYPTLNKATINY